MKRGDIVECVEKPGYLKFISRGKKYVVCDIEHHHGTDYIVILGDDRWGHTLHAALFALTAASQ